MTVDRLTIPDLTDDEQGWLDVLWAQLCDRRTGNLLRTGYYDFQHMANTSTALIAPQYRTVKAVLGWNTKAVDMLARRTNPEGFYWPDGDIDSLGYTDFAENNNLLAEIKGGLVSSLIHGVSFLLNTTGTPESGEPESLVHVKDALNATGWWNPRLRRLDAVLSITRWDSDTQRRPTGLVMYFDGLTVTCDRVDGQWEVSRQDHRYGMPAEALVYRPRTGRTFGSSRITAPQMDLQDRAMRAILRMEGHMDVYSVPQMWLLGADEGLFRNADGSQKAAWQIALGRMFAIPDDPELPPESPNARADVKQFPAQTPEPHMAQLSVLAKLFAREAYLPDAALAITDMANPTSADAYVAANDDLIAEAEGATDDWSLPLRRAVARGLVIQNRDPGLWERVRTIGAQWRSPMHVSRAAAADAGSKQLEKAPWLAETDVGLELLGLTPSQIERATAQRRRAQARQALASLIGSVAADDADAE